MAWTLAPPGSFRGDRVEYVKVRVRQRGKCPNRRIFSRER